MPIIGTIVNSFDNEFGHYQIRYDVGGNGFSVNFTGNNEQYTLSSSQRGGFNEGDYVGTLQTGPGTLVTFTASLTFPFLVATPGTVPIDDGSDGNSGGPSGCNIAITSLSTVAESAPGAANGTLTIVATTANLPISYSINNTTWVSSPVFSSLSGGSGTAYVTDALGCTAQQSYTVTTTPLVFNRLVSSPAIGQSRWSALFNPIIFGYQSATAVPGRKFITKITSGYDGAANVITATHAANLTGYCRADISKYLRTLLLPQDELNYTAINYRDANISASYTVEYKETWDGGSDTDWTSAGDPFYVTYSAMQIGNTTGGNMQPYVTYPGANQANPGKFLNDFKIPVLYTDMPWDISFIYSEKVAGYQLKLGGNGIDVNGNICGSLGESMLLNEDGSALLNEDGSKLLIERQAPGTLLNKLGVNRLRITQNIPANSNWLDVFLFYTDGQGNNIPVTESRRLLLDKSPCNGLPYEYLKWMGPTGGWLYYMLIKNQIHEITTTNPVLMDRYIADYAAADSTQQLISISAKKKITAGKNDIPAYEAEALATLLYSPKVYRLVNAATNTWQGVIIDTTSLKMYQTYGQTGDFEIAFILPEVNVQRA
ncbi:hypothetical protein BDD43_5153 [Mucilaginibacter gracilis]|uniref:Uncharacterized protein n=1 Tax=Mucilaginibacter gracilis TaxID=423350 RepID=A0A495J7D3_9SPHI|nr:hypothetical protein [Mucilaginibacter gracilis]RKR84900.1 hypothetical protein BDD43_5153 [Mucilaginibacter gracilis]